MQQLEPGTMVDAYRVERLAGRGAFGDVYRAHRADDPEPMALKLLTRREVDDEGIARILSRLDHPNIVRTLDVVRHQGQVCHIQEWADGGTLEYRLTAGAFSPPDATAVAQLGIEVASALAHAHSRGIVHRDVKPSNVLIVGGTYKLGDFGISAALELDTGVTATGQIAGTPLYMSPEQALGRPLSPTSDIFSLGLLLYRAVYGRLAELLDAGGDFLDLLDRRIRQEIDVPPSPFQPIIQQCLALDRERRPQAVDVERYFRDLLPSLPDSPREPQPAAPHSGSATTPLSDVQVEGVAQGAAAAPTPRALRAVVDRERPGLTSSAPTSSPPQRTALGAIVTGVVAAAAVAVPLGALAWLGTTHGWAWPGRLVVGGMLVVGGLVLSRLVRERLASKVPEIERRAADALFEAESRIELTQSLTIEVDELVRRLRTIDGRILGVTLKAMVDEYDTAKVSSDRIAALVNVVTIVEKLRVHLSPWHVRHKETISTSVAVIGCLSGVASVVSGFVV